VVSDFDTSASVAGAEAGGAWWTSTDNMGGAQGRVSPGPDDNVIPGSDDGDRTVGDIRRSWSGLMANTGVRRNGTSMSSVAAANGQRAALGAAS